jgi:hypothetical protein
MCFGHLLFLDVSDISVSPHPAVGELQSVILPEFVGIVFYISSRIGGPRIKGYIKPDSHCTETKMRAITILAIVTIVAALGAVTSMVPVQQVSAQVVVGGGGTFPPGPPQFPQGMSSHACGHSLPAVSPAFCSVP